MIKKFEQYNLDIDPYNEEDWGEKPTLDDYWNLINNNYQFFNKKIENIGGIDFLDFSCYVPGKGVVDFAIYINVYDQILLFRADNNVLHDEILTRVDVDELLDKIEILVEMT